MTQPNPFSGKVFNRQTVQLYVLTPYFIAGNTWCCFCTSCTLYFVRHTRQGVSKRLIFRLLLFWNGVVDMTVDLTDSHRQVCCEPEYGYHVIKCWFHCDSIISLISPQSSVAPWFFYTDMTILISIVYMQYMGLWVFSLPISLVMIVRKYVFCLIIIFKPEA